MNNFENQYFNPEQAIAFTGARNLINANKGTSSKIIKEWLTKHDTYSLHKPIRKKFSRLYYDVLWLDQVWEADLICLTALKTYNDNYGYLLVVIDVLSKYAWVEPLHNKTALEVTKAFEKILNSGQNRSPFMLQTDKGTEFLGSVFQSFLKENNIRFRVARSPDVKAAVVERFNRTLKERMFRYFTFKNTRRYIDVLPALVNGYNNTTHSIIKMKPAIVTIYNAIKARKNLLHAGIKRQKACKKPKCKIGDFVRISRERNVFAKGYEKGWSDEIFKIQKVKKSQKLFIYELCDLNGEIIDGFFYPEELSIVHKERVSDQEFHIDKIIKTRGKGSKKQYFVSWIGYSDQFNSWVNAKDMKNV